MHKSAFAAAATLTLLLAGCGGSPSAEGEAANNLQNTVENAAANLSDLSANVVDAGQANALVNESLELSNAGEAAKKAAD